jgi:hypothetical protein
MKGLTSIGVSIASVTFVNCDIDLLLVLSGAHDDRPELTTTGPRPIRLIERQRA